MDNKREQYLRELKKFWIENDIPNISEVNWKLLNFLIKKTNSKSWLEIWTANWYSTIWLWEAFEANKWKLLSYEIWEPSFLKAGENIKKTNLEWVVTLKMWNFLNINSSEGKFDFVFIDARKSEYLDYFTKIIPMLTKDAVVIFDDVIKFKDKMKDFYDYIEIQNQFEYFILPIDGDDWVLILN